MKTAADQVAVFERGFAPRTPNVSTRHAPGHESVGICLSHGQLWLSATQPSTQPSRPRRLSPTTTATTLGSNPHSLNPRLR
jgi:hypothetical protein